MKDQKQMKDLQDWAKQVWMLTTLEDKKLVALDMVANFEFKAKANAFETQINKTKSLDKLDMLVGNIVLAGEGLAAK